MIRAKFDSRAFKKEMDNIVDYAIGFTDGVKTGKNAFLSNLGDSTLEMLKEYIDSNARVNPEALHHVYEWHQTGSPSARLFDLKFTVSGLGLSFISNFKQSTTIKSGSFVPFYDKAKVMEAGMSVKIKPRNKEFLRFEVDGEEVFTDKQVTVDNPGGSLVAGQFERVFDSFFNNYFTQSYLKSSGILEYLKNPTVFKKDLPSGARAGKSKGISTGYRWIANAGVVR